jgi:hypothetical protein
MRLWSSSSGALVVAGTLEDKNVLAMMIGRKSEEVALELTDQQYAKLRRA